MSLSFKELFSFSTKGRYNRAKYWGYSIATPIVLGILTGIILAILFSAVGEIGDSLSLVFAVILYILILFYIFKINIKRLHDLDKTGWMSLLAFVPFANIYLFIICGFFKGTDGKNKYGEDPLKNVPNTEL